MTADDDDDNDGFYDQDELTVARTLDTSSKPTNTEGEICEKLADGGRDDGEDGGLAWWCFPLCFLLLLLLLVPLLLFRDKVIGVIDDAEQKTLPRSLSS